MIFLRQLIIPAIHDMTWKFYVDLFPPECHVLAGVADGRIGCSFCDSFILETFLLLKISPAALDQGRGRGGDFILPRAECQDLWALLLEWRGENGLHQWGCSLHRQPGRAQGPCTSRTNLSFTNGCPSASCGCTWGARCLLLPSGCSVSATFHMAPVLKKKKKFL